MASESGPFIVKNGLVMSLDAANERSFRGEPTTNTVTYPSAGASRYNNPGFSGSIVNTGQTFLGSPIWEVTFIPQNSSFIPRLASSEGFGFFHGFGTRLFPNADYMASVYFKTDYPLQASTSQGFANTYSNIPGWGAYGTSNTRLSESGWTRLYTRYNNTVLINGVNYSQRSVSNTLTVPVNTTALTQVLVTITIQANGTFSVSTNAGNTSTGTITDFSNHQGVRSASPSITNAGGISGLSTGTSAVLNHGLDDSSWTKLSDSNVVMKANYPFNYYVLLNIPSTSGNNVNINLNLNFNGIYSSLSDNKFWKVTFNTSNLQVDEVIRTYWAAPMIEQHTRTLPSRFVIGTRGTTVAGGGGWADLSKNDNHGEVLNGVGYNSGNGGSWEFDGLNDYITFVNPISPSQPYSIIQWVKPSVVLTDTVLVNGTGRRTPFVGVGPRWNPGYWLTARNFRVHANTEYRDVPINWVNDLGWHQIGQIYDGTTCYAIVDGKVVLGSRTSYSPLSATTLHIGAETTAGNSFNWNGLVSNLLIYNRQISPQEVYQNFISTRRRFGL